MGIPNTSRNNSQQTGFNVIEILRWLCVLPVAFLASWLGYHLGGVFYFLHNSIYPDFLFPLFALIPKGVASIFVGALMAPRFRFVVAVSLTVLCLLLSLQIHILGQSNRGLNNYMHFTGESIGALLGILVILYLDKKSEMRTTGEVES